MVNKIIENITNVYNMMRGLCLFGIHSKNIISYQSLHDSYSYTLWKTASQFATFLRIVKCDSKYHAKIPG